MRIPSRPVKLLAPSGARQGAQGRPRHRRPLLLNEGLRPSPFWGGGAGKLPDEPQFTIPKRKLPPKGGSPLPRGGGGKRGARSAAAAAAGEQQDDEDDPDPVVVVEHVAQTVVHSEPPKKI